MKSQYHFHKEFHRFPNIKYSESMFRFSQLSHKFFIWEPLSNKIFFFWQWHLIPQCFPFNGWLFISTVYTFICDLPCVWCGCGGVLSLPLSVFIFYCTCLDFSLWKISNICKSKENGMTPTLSGTCHPASVIITPEASFISSPPSSHFSYVP